MTKKMMLLAVTAVAALAFAAMPAIASAAPTVDFSKTGNIPFTGTSSVSLLRNAGFAGEVECTSDTNSGEWTSGTTGTLQVKFKNCKNKATGIACNSANAATGEIVTDTGVFHLVYIKGFPKTVGTLLTPSTTTGNFATFSCGSLFKVVVSGNGIVAHVTKPACGETSSKSTISATATGASQTYKEVEGDTHVYHLTSSLNGGTASEASEETTEETELSGGATGTLTCL
ncbi:MAG: hypothetical protein ACTHN3_10110 [Solirubrobacterales bacterium]